MALRASSAAPDEQSGLQKRIATTESISLCADEKLTALLELESAIRVAEPIDIDIADLGRKLARLK